MNHNQPLSRARSMGTRRALRQRNRRVVAHREIVRPLALHYAHRSPEPSEDLMQVGLMGLIRAAELYDRDRRTPFEAFARPHMQGVLSIQRSLTIDEVDSVDGRECNSLHDATRQPSEV